MKRVKVIWIKSVKFIFLRLQKANQHLDEASARLLIERALIKDEQGEYNFSRDLYVKLTVTWKHYYNHSIIWVTLIFICQLDVFKRSLYWRGRDEIRNC